LRFTLRLLIAAFGLFVTISLSRFFSVEILAEFSFVVITSLFLAEISRMAVDQSLIRRAINNEIDKRFIAYDFLFGIFLLIILIILISLFIPLSIKENTPAILFNALFIYTSKSISPLLVIGGFKDYAVLIREGMLVLVRGVFAIGILWFSGSYSGFMELVGLYSFVFSILILTLIFFITPALSDKGGNNCKFTHVVRHHFAQIKVFISTSPVSLFNTLISFSFQTQGAHTAQAVYHIFNSIFSLINMMAVMSATRVNKEVLEFFNDKKRIKVIYNNVIYNNLSIFVPVSIACLLFGNHIISLWGVYEFETIYFTLMFSLYTFSISVSGLWLVILEKMGIKGVVFYWTILIVFSLLLLSLLNVDYFLVGGLSLLAVDRLIKGYLSRRALKQYENQ
jgi:hypothetical protein